MTCTLFLKINLRGNQSTFLIQQSILCILHAVIKWERLVKEKKKKRKEKKRKEKEKKRKEKKRKEKKRRQRDKTLEFQACPRDFMNHPDVSFICKHEADSQTNISDRTRVIFPLGSLMFSYSIIQLII